MSGKRADFDPHRFDCAFVDAGERCAELGTFTESTTGSERWYCFQHYRPFRNFAKPVKRGEHAPAAPRRRDDPDLHERELERVPGEEG